MSCYEWERGEIVLPTKCYTKFRQDIIKAWNDWQLKLLALAKKAVPILRKTNPQYPSMELQKESWEFRQLGEAELCAVVHLIPRKDGKWPMPKKQNLRLLPISKGRTLYLEEASIGLRDENHSVVWSVLENNHACDRAHEHPIAKVLFRMLGNVQWVRGTGGTIVGNDEYHRDSDYEGGGGNYVKQRFGPK